MLKYSSSVILFTAIHEGGFPMTQAALSHMWVPFYLEIKSTWIV